MNNIKEYIHEKLVINKNIKSRAYSCYPKTKDELRKILEERLAKDKNANLNDIDVSKITDMSELFYELNPHNIDISDWDVSNVEDMQYMFNRCEHFNCDLGNWTLSSVKNMKYMFYDCCSFKGDNLEKWNIPITIKQFYMFVGCTSLKNIPQWNKKFKKIYEGG